MSHTIGDIAVTIRAISGDGDDVGTRLFIHDLDSRSRRPGSICQTLERVVMSGKPDAVAYDDQ